MSTDPTALAQLYDFIRTGQGTMAAGLVLTVLVAGLRHGVFGRFAPTKAWAESKLGGYVLGFGTSLLAYLATAFTAGQAFTVMLLLNALGAGFVAAGGWEHLQDVLGFIKSTTPPGPGTGKPLTVTLVLVVMLTLGFSSGCTKNDRITTLRGSYITYKAAAEGFATWNATHEMDIADDPALTTKEAVQAKVAAYRAERQKVLDGFKAARDLLLIAALQTDDPSLKAALAQVTQVLADAEKIEADFQTSKGGK